MRAPRGVSLTHSAHTMPARANQKKIIFGLHVPPLRSGSLATQRFGSTWRERKMPSLVATTSALALTTCVRMHSVRTNNRYNYTNLEDTEAKHGDTSRINIQRQKCKQHADWHAEAPNDMDSLNTWHFKQHAEELLNEQSWLQHQTVEKVKVGGSSRHGLPQHQTSLPGFSNKPCTVVKIFNYFYRLRSRY